jgi:branched-chain amino acid transport system ATP-binding protein
LPPTIDVTSGHVLAAERLRCGYQGVAVVHDFELNLVAGEIVALLGANGSGKSTTLATLAGVLSPLGGTITLFSDPRSTSLQRRARAGLGYLKEGTSVFPTLTVAQNLKLGRGDPERAYSIAPQLRELRNRRGGLLSGGEQRILAVARALAAEPRVLLVDELSLGLAPRITDMLLELLRAQADRGTAVVLVEQHPAAALAIADRVMVMRRGTVVLESSAGEIADDVGHLHDLYFGV